MIVAFAGSGALDQAVVSRLRGAFHVKQVADVNSLEKIAPDCDCLLYTSDAADE